MTPLLWTLVVAGGAQALAIVICLYARRFPLGTPTSRAIDCIYTIGMGAWALWLLAGGDHA